MGQKFSLVMYGRECYILPVEYKEHWKVWRGNRADLDLPEYLKKVEDLEEFEFILEDVSN